MEMIKFNYMLEIDILRNSSPKQLGVLRGAFEGFGCSKRHPDALLAKTMPSAFDWLLNILVNEGPLKILYKGKGKEVPSFHLVVT